MSRSDAENAIRSRVQTVYVGNRRVLSRILGRLKLYMSTEDLGFAGHVMLDGYWEIWLTRFFARYLKPGMTIFDVGANFGYYTLLFGDAVGTNGHVTAVEPLETTADLLAQSVALNGFAGHTRIVRAALGREPDTKAHLFVPAGEPKNATVISAARPGSIVVPSTTLDALAEKLPRIDLVKIDAEGAEEDIFAGMQATIARHRPSLLLEFNAARYADPQRFLADLLDKYPAMRALDFNGDLAKVKVKADEVLSTRFGEDWLLFFEPKT